MFQHCFSREVRGARDASADAGAGLVMLQLAQPAPHAAVLRITPELGRRSDHWRTHGADIIPMASNTASISATAVIGAPADGCTGAAAAAVGRRPQEAAGGARAALTRGLRGPANCRTSDPRRLAACDYHGALREGARAAGAADARL